MLIRAKESALVVTDIQERLVPAMQAPARTLSNTKPLLHAANENAIHELKQAYKRTRTDEHS